MHPGQKRLLALVAAMVFTVAAAWLGLLATGAMDGSGEHYKMSDRIADLEVVETPAGKRFQFEDEQLTPEEFAAEHLERRPTGKRGTVFRFLNITSMTGLFWVALGFLGQVLFTGRMVVQWLASEKEKRPVVPDVFWWMSLGGATMLIIYFIWRVDIVGIIGQATGWFIYVRNLWFIYGRRAES